MKGLAVMTSGKLGKSGCLCQIGDSSSREQFFVKFTYFATLILRKVKEIGLIATTRFEDLDLNCVIGWFKKNWDRLMTSL